MKKLIAGTFLLSLVIAATAQGLIQFDNTGNSNPSPTATSGGLFFLKTSDAATPVPINQDFNVAFYVGTDSANLSLFKIFSLSDAVGDNAFGAGTFIDLTGRSYAVPGTTTASTTAFFQIEAWTGNYRTYADAISGIATGLTFFCRSAPFSNPVASPPNPHPTLPGCPRLY